jgi:putative oxidoreductase
MLKISSLYDRLILRIEQQTWILPSAARLIFTGVLALYFFNSAVTKVGDGLFGIFSPSSGAYIQIFPKIFEAAAYDPTNLSMFHHLVVYVGIYAEFALPTLIMLGLFTRMAALGLIGFVALQSLTDIFGHCQLDALGSWFDRFPDAAILDQRALWIFILLALVVKGAGPLSLDRWLLLRR